MDGASPSTQLAIIRRRTQQMNKSSHRLLGDLTRTPEPKLQSRVRRPEAALYSDSLLEVGTIPQMPFANATSLMVPNASNLKDVEGGLTPLTPDLLHLRQNVTFVNINDKDRTLQQLVITKQDKLRDKPYPTPERIRPYGHPRLQDAITLHPIRTTHHCRWTTMGTPRTTNHLSSPPRTQHAGHTITYCHTS